MANPLTGEFEAVLQISVRQINGILATLHQNGSDTSASPQLLHSVTLRVGEAAAGANPKFWGMQKWLRQTGSQFLTSNENSEAPALLLTKLPPGLAGTLANEFVEWNGALKGPDLLSEPHGKVEVQISSPTLSVVEGSTSELTVSVSIRAHFYPDHDSVLLPEPFHGEVRIAYEVKVVNSSSGPKLQVVPSSDDNKIRFISAVTGFDAAQQKALNDQVRIMVREKFMPTEVSLPGGFSFRSFRGLVSDPSHPDTQTLAMPVSLSGGEPSGDIHTLTTPLRDGKEFALAVSRKYVNGVFQPQLNALATAITQFRPTVSGLGITVTYEPHLNPPPTITWQDNGFVLSMGILAQSHSGSVIGGAAPNVQISVSQGLTPILDASTQNVALQPAGDLVIRFDLGLPDWLLNGLQGNITHAIVTARDQLLAVGSAVMSQAFARARESFRLGLHSFDSWATAKFSQLQVSKDGIILRGDIGTARRQKTFAHFHEADGSYNALESWVPGGRIIKHHWAASGIATRLLDNGVVVGDSTTIMPEDFGPDPNGYDQYGFVRSKPDLGPGKHYSQVCLSVEATQISPDGGLMTGDAIGGFYSTGGTCIPTPPHPIIVIPEDWKHLTIHDFGPPGPVENPLEQFIVRHFDMASDSPLDPEVATNNVVHFTNWNADKPLAGLSEALSGVKDRPTSFAVVVVLPAGSFKLSRREFDAKIGLGEAVKRADMRAVPMYFAEDVDGGWSRTFDAKKSPATFLLNTRGEYVWKHDGELQPAAFGEALAKHALPAAAPRGRLLRTAVRPGMAVPDVYFHNDAGEFTTMRRLRGRPVLMNFWQSWSQPSMQELSRLQVLHEKRGTSAPVIIAHSGDEDARVLARVRNQNKLTFALAHDRYRELARQFRVRCWPTTISINADGIVDHVQYGTALPNGGKFPASG
jgi:peroxiredoxin